MKKGIRLDAFLVEKKYSQSREKAKKEIISGWVSVNGETIRDPARLLKDDPIISINRPGGKFASRGGEKLDDALQYFMIDVEAKVAADLGASTGGFTDCLLKRGASLVYAIDVGYGQLDYNLRIDERVIVKERCNVRNLTKDDFNHDVEIVTADLSFISLSKIVPALLSTFDHFTGIFLVKPQFEAEKKEHKKGVVKDKEIHRSILMKVIKNFCDNGLHIKGLHHSPLLGPAGNMEFFVHFLKLKNPHPEKTNLDDMIINAVEEAYRILA